MGHLGDRLEVHHLKCGIGNGFTENRACLVVDGVGKVLRIVGVHELHRDAEFRQDVVELGVGAAVEVARADDVVAGLGEVDDAVEHAARARRETETGHLMRTLEHGDAFLEYVRGRVHQAGIDVPEFPEREEIRRMFSVVELECSRAIDRHGAGSGGRVRLRTPVKTNGIELHFWMAENAGPSDEPARTRGRHTSTRTTCGDHQAGTGARRPGTGE